MHDDLDRSRSMFDFKSRSVVIRHAGGSQERTFDPAGSHDKNVSWIQDPRGSHDKGHDRIFDPIGSHDLNEGGNMCAGLWRVCSS